MKTSLVIASVLLAGVALEVSAFRITNDYGNQHESDKQWVRLQQKSLGSSDGSFALDTIAFTQNFDDEFQNYKQNDRFNKHMSNKNTDYNFADRSRQYDQSVESYSDSSEEFGAQTQNYRSNNHVSVDQSAGLTKKIVQKIAAIQKIAVDHNVASDFYSEMNLNNNAIKLSEQNFVTFYNTTMKNLNNGDLNYLYINSEKDIVFVQYEFDEVETSGSFKSNIRSAKSGYYTIVLNKVYSNVSTGFNNKHTVIRPANFQFADAMVKTDDGAETQVFNDALEHKYLRELGHAVSSQVLRATDMGMIGQMKNEARKPMTYYYNNNNEKKGKLFDMRWKEDSVSMEMYNIGFQYSEQAAQQLRFKSVSIQSKSENTYKMLYDFALDDLKWTSALTIESSGKRMNTRSVDFEVKKAYIQVAITKSLNRQQQQQMIDDIDTNVSIRGLQYNFNEDVPSELRNKVDEKFKRFFEHSLESYVLESLKQEFYYNYKH